MQSEGADQSHCKAALIFESDMGKSDYEEASSTGSLAISPERHERGPQKLHAQCHSWKDHNINPSQNYLQLQE